MTITRKIIKEETKHTTLQEIKELADSEKLSLFETIDENHIHNNFIEDLIIFEEQSHNQLPTEFGSETYKVFKEINNLKSFGRKKRSWYTKENLVELKTILLKYPHFHKIIRKRLNIPIGTWNKLKREVEMLSTNKWIPKWRRNAMHSLSDKEKDFVQRLLIPPTTPLTKNKI